ncbi:hypothetical protein ACFQE1_00225 [Halobium palmae]|uniref:Uncharacterized protein n=1 Tax=Halobium palmae TaxID=1776492 RepID=A0ABD5RUF6_9EURY
MRDNIAEAQTALAHAIDSESYDQLSAKDQAYLQEAAHFLTLVQN